MLIFSHKVLTVSVLKVNTIVDVRNISYFNLLLLFYVLTFLLYSKAKIKTTMVMSNQGFEVVFTENVLCVCVFWNWPTKTFVSVTDHKHGTRNCWKKIKNFTNEWILSVSLRVFVGLLPCANMRGGSRAIIYSRWFHHHHRTHTQNQCSKKVRWLIKKGTLKHHFLRAV